MKGINDITQEEWDEIARLALDERDEILSDDMVNSPAHYNDGEIETIDYIVDVLGEWNSIHYCHGNIIKYLSTRLWAKGNPLQDAKKARWYLNKMIELMEQTEGEHW